MKDADKDVEQQEVDEDTMKSTESATEPATDDLSKTPVERGYPSNDLEYYINHPNEPMPREIQNELMAPDYYSP